MIATIKRKPPGTVELLRARWWRWNDAGLMELIVPRQHDDNMWRSDAPYGTPEYRAAQETCAASGCYLCTAMLTESNIGLEGAP